MFLHAQITPYFSFEPEEFCLQTLRMRLDIHFAPFCQEDATKWKKSSRIDKIPHLYKRDFGCEKHPT